MAEDKKSGGLKSVLEELPLDRLREELSEAAKALGEKGLQTVTEKITGATDSLNGIAEGGGVMGQAAKEGTKSAAEGDNPVGGALKGGLSGVKDKVKGALPGGGGNSGSKATKSTNIIEEIDIGVPIDVAYNQWTQFQDFSGFMKKVDSVDQEEDEKVTFKAQVFWSHRTWEATIIEQVPNERIIWKSKGEKGHVDGAVTFHELGPNLTRVLVVLEYYPQGLFERTGNLWRAQGRRARLELKHFRRHVMTRAILEEDELEGWRGEIRDGEVVRDHDEVVEEEEQEREDQERDDEGYDAEDEFEEPEGEEAEDEEPEEDDEPEDEFEEPEDEEAEDEEPEEEDEPEDEFEEPEDEEAEDEYEEPEDEYEEPEDEDEPEDEGVDEEEPEEEYDELEDDELEDEEPEEEEPEEKPRRRASSKRTSTRKRR